MTATDYGVEYRVELGIGRQANAAVWDTGRWDAGAVWGNPATSLGDWVDVTCDTAEPFTLTAGASDADGVVTRWEAATCALGLYGASYDPWSGPWAGILGPQVAMRVSWRHEGDTAWLAAFTGAIAADGFHWVPGNQPHAEISATDATQALAAFDPPERAATGLGDTAAERVNRILDVAAWPAGLRDVTAGGVKLKSSTMANALWTQLLAVADTDLALLWFRRDGRLSFRPEGRVGVGTQLAGRLVVCDNPSDPNDVQVVTIGGAQFADIRNIVSISRQKEEGGPDAATATVRDEGSIARYLPRAYTRTDLQHQDDSWSTTVANTVLAASAWPSRAPREAVLSSRLGNPNAVNLLLSLEPDMSFDVEDTAGGIWREACVGWHVTAGRHRIDGTLTLSDISKWVAARWDSGEWDTDRWSFAVTVPALERADNGDGP